MKNLYQNETRRNRSQTHCWSNLVALFRMLRQLSLANLRAHKPYVKLVRCFTDHHVITFPMSRVYEFGDISFQSGIHETPV